MSALHDLLTELERHLISAYLAGAGHDLEKLEARGDAEARSLLAEASRYASVKLSEVEARSRYLHELRGEGM
jgi:regulator of protease activity HflC (stomatin/prohibitin superfamily)